MCSTDRAEEPCGPKSYTAGGDITAVGFPALDGTGTVFSAEGQSGMC
ncbi:hypothetical protein HMPREF9141_2142 [Prevotella multiformis DSM 16608]|uniref:Uncharacterized protein n=1 Tax=Prevotella multiformis DSM 16608 TaxID=888743 RepID=F0F975_9BACT|nr:hypothetical protein HMPREF9141_2142 [Prevotella multiformis DSM 16608]